MHKAFKGIIAAHGKTALLTFEIFWIVIFLLEQLGGQTAKGIPEFIYVNF